MKANRVLLSLLTVTVLAAPAFAGGPIAQCAPGQAFVWGGGGANIPYNPDQGDLGPVPGPAAVALVEAAFQVWTDVPTSSVSYLNAGFMPVDVDEFNWPSYFAVFDGLNSIIFDDNGGIFSALGFPPSVLGCSKVLTPVQL